MGLGFLLRKNKEDKSMQEFKPVKEGKVREVYDNGDS
ncbi:MAG: phosphoribosylaminoimidazolesuccinocarboxamide synthase, partial [Roseburia inulinivorans]|nr:phosphoribosylaminoimidazolesuccinocarboxamide synthase [Roseburia inulinivorans]